MRHWIRSSQRRHPRSRTTHQNRQSSIRPPADVVTGNAGTPSEHSSGHSSGHADYHDPLAGIGGAPPAYSALTLRMVLAIFGLLVCTAGAVLFALVAAPVVFVVLFAVFAAVAVVDIVVVARRKLRGEPG
jgi:hypothetical protein